VCSFSSFPYPKTTAVFAGRHSKSNPSGFLDPLLLLLLLLLLYQLFMVSSEFFRISTIELEYLDASSQFIVCETKGFSPAALVVEPLENAKYLWIEIPVS